MTVLVETFRALLRRNPTLPAEVLRGAYTASAVPGSATNTSAPWMCRQELAQRADLPVDLLSALAGDPHPSVRSTALGNPRVPADVLHAACRRENDRGALQYLACHLTDGPALDLLARRRLPEKFRTKILIGLLTNLATPSQAAARVLLRLDPMLPAGTLEVGSGAAGELLEQVDNAICERLTLEPALCRDLFGQLTSMRARFISVMHAPLDDAQRAALVAELVLDPLAAVPAPTLPDDLAHRAANVLAGKLLSADLRAAVLTALAGRNWRRSNYRSALDPHLADDSDGAVAAQAAAEAALAARIAGCTDPGELAELAESEPLTGATARALVANPHTPVTVAVTAAAGQLRFGDAVTFVADTRGGDEEFLLGYARANPRSLPQLPGAGRLTRLLLTEFGDGPSGGYQAASWARSEDRLALLSAEDRLALPWPTARALAGIEGGFDDWLLDVLSTLLGRPGGGELLTRVDAAYTGTVAGLLTLLEGTLSDADHSHAA